MQLELPFEESDTDSNLAKSEARRRLDDSIDSARERFGRKSLGYASVDLTDSHSVPDAFRELAEKSI